MTAPVSGIWWATAAGVPVALTPLRREAEGIVVLVDGDSERLIEPDGATHKGDITCTFDELEAALEGPAT